MEQDSEILPSDDDDLFGEGMIVSSSDVTMPPPAPAAPIHEPEIEIIPAAPDPVYDRETATVAPDGSSLTQNQIDNPHLFRKGDPRPPSADRPPRKANRINVREQVARLQGKTGLGPIEILYHIMVANEESRKALELTKSVPISPNLRAKAATELLAYMAPKLKSVEVKAGDDKKSTGVQIFLPANTREHGKLAQQPVIQLPEKDGVQIPFSPELAEALIDQQDADEQDWPEED